jgi:predicted small lipoprotein YifL
MPTTKIILLILFTTLLCACGHKGPLYLPDEETATEQASPTDEEKKDEEKENAARR